MLLLHIGVFSLWYAIMQDTGMLHRGIRRALPAPVLACVLILWAVPVGARGPLHSIGQIRHLAPAEAAEALPVELEAQVVRCDVHMFGVFVYDGTDGIYIEREEDASLFLNVAAGDIVRVRGVTTKGGYSPTVLARSVEVLARKPLPSAPRLGPEEINNSLLDCQWRSVEGRLVDMLVSPGLQSITLMVEMYGGVYKVHLVLRPEELEKLAGLMFTRVRFNAVLGTVFNEDRQYTGRVFFCDSASDFVRVGPKPAETGLAEIHELLRSNFDSDQLVHVRATITHAAHRDIYLRGSRASMKAVLPEWSEPLAPGDVVELAGIAWREPIKPSFRVARARKVGVDAVPVPVALDTRTPIDTRFHQELVRIDAELVNVGESYAPSQASPEEVRRASLLCRAGGLLFRAELKAGEGFDATRLRPGSRVRLVGICHLIPNDEVSWQIKAEGFMLELGDPSAITVTKMAPWWDAEHLLWFSGTLMACLGIVGAWVALLRRTIRKQTGIIAEKIERESILNERQRVARELHDHLDQGLTGTAVQLQSCRKFIDKYLGAVLDSIRTSARLAEKHDGELAAQLGACLQTIEADVERSRQGLAAVQDMLGYCGDESRRAILDLRSGLLERMDLPDALKASFSPAASRFDGTIDVEVRGGIAPCRKSIERNLLLVAREAVANAVRHSGARTIRVVLAGSPALLRLEIVDDGCGFDPEGAAPAGRFGLQGLRERCMQMGGSLEIASSGKGTRVAVEVPIEGRKEQDS